MDTTLEPIKEPVGATSRAGLWAILAVVLIADMLDLMDSTLTNIAAPTIVAELGGGAGLLKWLGSAYALALGSLLVLGGRLGDRFGQRRVFLIASPDSHWRRWPAAWPGRRQFWSSPASFKEASVLC